MSAEDKDTDDASFPAEDMQTEGDPQPRRWLPRILVGLVMLAIPVIGYVVVSMMQSDTISTQQDDTIARVQAELRSSRETINALNGKLGEQQEALRGERDRIDTLQRSVAELSERIDQPAELLGSVPSRIASLERGLASLQGVSEGTRDNWLLAEAEYFMQIANAQAELAQNPVLAAAALRQADERVAELSNPAYLPIRAEIADEIAALSLMTDVDIAGMTLMLSSLARVVDSLPVKSDEAQEVEPDTAIDPDAGSFSRAWDAVKDTASRAVTITRPGEERSPLLTPESESLLRANLSLQLQAARLALLKGERRVFLETLSDADNWLVTYFDTESVQVVSARETLSDIRDNPAMDDMPDISGSLAALRRLRTLGGDGSE